MEYIESKYFSYADPDDPWYRKLIIRTIESMAGQPALYKPYREYQENPNNWDSFWHGCLDQLKLKLDFNTNIDIPKEGPTIFVANHPYGVLDGLVISYFVSKFRDDFKVLTHSLLLRAPETKGYLLPIDFTGDKQALLTNLDTRKKSREHLANKGTNLNSIFDFFDQEGIEILSMRNETNRLEELFLKLTNNTYHG